MKKFILYYEATYEDFAEVLAESEEDALDQFYCLPVDKLVDYQVLNHNIEVDRVVMREFREGIL